MNEKRGSEARSAGVTGIERERRTRNEERTKERGEELLCPVHAVTSKIGRGEVILVAQGRWRGEAKSSKRIADQLQCAGGGGSASCSGKSWE